MEMLFHQACWVLLVFCGLSVEVRSQTASQILCSVLADSQFIRPGGLNSTVEGSVKFNNLSDFILGTGRRTIICLVTVAGSGSTAPNFRWNINGTEYSPPTATTSCTGSVQDFSRIVSVSTDRWNVSLALCRPTRVNATAYNLTLASALVESVNLYAAPLFTSVPRNSDNDYNAFVQVRCTANGYPAPVITWWRNDLQIDLEDWPRYNVTARVVSGTPKTYSIVESTLHIRELDYIDRNTGPFQCRASSDLPAYASSNAIVRSSTFLVRVRDPLAALWPFLGICAQVVILTGFLQYDKRQQLAKSMGGGRITYTVNETGGGSSGGGGRAVRFSDNTDAASSTHERSSKTNGSDTLLTQNPV